MRSLRQALATLFLSALVQACSNDEEVVLSGDPTPNADAGAVARVDGAARVDGGARGDAGPVDGGVNRVDVPLPQGDASVPGDGSTPGPERCNGEDDDGDGVIDETCACAPGTLQRCYPGPAGTRTRGTCTDGNQRCEGMGEFGTWGPCEGAVTPAADVCGDAMDQDCNGTPDDGDGCCREGATMACYTGPAGTQGVGPCRAGVRTCNASGAYGACAGEVLPAAERCNGVDDDCDGTIDEECQTCIVVTGASTPWQIHLGEGPRCWGRTFERHGDPAEYAFASIPPERDGGWRPHTPPSISFDDPSTLCGVCDCRAGGDFTYFQTTFYVPPTLAVRSLRVTIANVDDGVSVTVFNSRYPNGIVDPGAFAFLGGGSTADLATYVVPGREPRGAHARRRLLHGAPHRRRHHHPER